MKVMMICSPIFVILGVVFVIVGTRLAYKKDTNLLVGENASPHKLTFRGISALVLGIFTIIIGIENIITGVAAILYKQNIIVLIGFIVIIVTQFLALIISSILQFLTNERR